MFAPALYSIFTMSSSCFLFESQLRNRKSVTKQQDEFDLISNE